MSLSHSLAVVLCEASPERAHFVLERLRQTWSDGFHGACFYLCEEGEVVSSDSGVEPLHIDQLGLPDQAAYPWSCSVANRCLALSPWIVEHLSSKGFNTILCVDDQPESNDLTAEHVVSLISSWLHRCDTSTQVWYSEDDATLMVRPGDHTTLFIAQRQRQLAQAAGHALVHAAILRRLPFPPEVSIATGKGIIGTGQGILRIAAAPLTIEAQDASHYEDIRQCAPASLSSDLMRVQRLHHIYRTTVGTPADTAAIHRFAHLTDTRSGRWRLRLNLLKARALSFNVSRLPAAQPEPVATRATETHPVWTSSAGEQVLRAPGGINLMGYVRAELGLGEAARSLASACHAAKLPFSVTDLGHQTLHPQADHEVLSHDTALRYAIDLHYVNASHARQTHELLKQQGWGRNRYTIGFWHWEQPILPRIYHQDFQFVDEVWAPSTFVVDAIAPVSPVPVVKVPHAIACEASAQARRALFALPEDRLLVLVMYDFLSYQHRKNPEAAIAAYRLAAQSTPGLGLVIKTINGPRHPEALAALKCSVADLPHVYFVDDFLSRQQTWDLQACCDILLSLHRAEGFGLAPAEMMRLGKAVVATGWSANMDFMTNDNAMPVRFSLIPLAQDVGAYPAGPVWAEADIEHAAWCLNRLARDHDFRCQLGAKASEAIRQQLAPATVGRQIFQRLQMIEHWHPELRIPPLSN